MTQKGYPFRRRTEPNKPTIKIESTLSREIGKAASKWLNKNTPKLKKIIKKGKRKRWEI